MNEKTNELLEDIKNLLILQLIKGTTPASTEEVGESLGVSGRTIRKVATSIKKPRKPRTKKTLDRKK
jgi:hypothetical protein